MGAPTLTLRFRFYRGHSKFDKFRSPGVRSLKFVIATPSKKNHGKLEAGGSLPRAIRSSKEISKSDFGRPAS